jgi:molybdopterin/thiamine biosynthesis adenylyltransferase
MNIDALTFYNNYFSSQARIKKIREFIFESESSDFKGEISIAVNNTEYFFDVSIPETYPLNDLQFISKTFEGYPHQNSNNSICLNTSFVNHTYSRLTLELEKLTKYIERYVQAGEEDDFYEYSTFDPQFKMGLIYQESDFDESRFKIPYGTLIYSPINESKENSKITRQSGIVLSIGNREYNWSEFYVGLKEKYKGVWVYLEKEPVHNKKKRFTEWSDLVKLLPKNFKEYFLEFCHKTPIYELAQKGAEENIMLMVGYKIPKEKFAGYELTWDLILIPHNHFPRKHTPFINNYAKKILWDFTSNASYERFFGRGGLTPKLANSKVLIIGNGAIGSSLSNILVRGGLRRLSLIDFELIDSGNICRSVYDFCDVGMPKTGKLVDKLRLLSPFIDVDIPADFKLVLSSSPDYTKVYDVLTKYDVIFDCTANNEVIQMLSDFNLENTIYYLSVSNKAKQMVCVTNMDNKNMIERRNQMLHSFGNFKEAEFREGTGCWHPTFEASFFDINQLLNYTISKINSQFKIGIPNSFYATFTGESIHPSEDVHFIQPKLNLRLTIESQVLKRVEGLARKYFPHEFGGILIGSYLKGFNEAVISDIITTDKFKSSPVNFQPDNKELNKKLKKLHSEFEGKIEYLGDWHSHPDSSNCYSNEDLYSITKVAKSKGVNTHNPILLIVAIGRNYFDPGFYVYFNEKLLKYDRL